MEEVDYQEAVPEWGQGAYGKSLYFPLNFETKTPLKNKMHFSKKILKLNGNSLSFEGGLCSPHYPQPEEGLPPPYSWEPPDGAAAAVSPPMTPGQIGEEPGSSSKRLARIRVNMGTNRFLRRAEMKLGE